MAAALLAGHRQGSRCPRPTSALAPLLLAAAALATGAAGTAAASERADEAIVVSPSAGEDKPDKMLVFIPGGKVPNERYIATAMAIQEAVPQLRLWVVIPAVEQRLCIISCSTPSLCGVLRKNIDGALDLAQQKGWKRGDAGKDIWLAGHSLGGKCANNLVQNYGAAAKAFAGLALMGSYVDEAGAFDLTSYPMPVLTLNTELDGGLARPGKTSIWWRQFLALADEQGVVEATSRKPVIVLPKLNHSDFCPGFDVPKDLMAEVSQEEATATIGSVVGAWLVAQTPELSATARGDALGALKERIDWTRGFLSPYLVAQDMELAIEDKSISSEGGSPFCTRAQHVIAGLSSSDDKRLSVSDGFHAKSTGLEHCHPHYMSSSGGVLNTTTCSHTDYYTDIANTGSITAASEIACKMLSSDRVAEQLNSSAARPFVPCSDINRLAVEVAISLAAEPTLVRYRRYGRGICFLDDTPVAGNVGPLWVLQASLKLTENATCLAASSPVLKTGLDSKIYPGSHYCKVLSPARVLDWMMTDSLKQVASLQTSPERAEERLQIVV